MRLPTATYLILIFLDYYVCYSPNNNWLFVQSWMPYRVVTIRTQTTSTLTSTTIPTIDARVRTIPYHSTTGSRRRRLSNHPTFLSVFGSSYLDSLHVTPDDDDDDDEDYDKVQQQQQQSKLSDRMTEDYTLSGPNSSYLDNLQERNNNNFPMDHDWSTDPRTNTGNMNNRWSSVSSTGSYLNQLNQGNNVSPWDRQKNIVSTNTYSITKNTNNNYNKKEKQYQPPPWKHQEGQSKVLVLPDVSTTTTTTTTKEVVVQETETKYDSELDHGTTTTTTNNTTSTIMSMDDAKNTVPDKSLLNKQQSTTTRDKTSFLELLSISATNRKQNDGSSDIPKMEDQMIYLDTHNNNDEFDDDMEESLMGTDTLASFQDISTDRRTIVRKNENDWIKENENDRETLVQQWNGIPTISDNNLVHVNGVFDPNEFEYNEKMNEESIAFDTTFMKLAIDLASSEECIRSSYPNPTVGAVWVTDDGSILGQAFSSYLGDAIRLTIASAEIEISSVTGNWTVSAPSNEITSLIASSTLYVTLEPSSVRRGSASPPITQLIELVGIPRVVIGSVDPVAERKMQGAMHMHSTGVTVSLGQIMQPECDALINEYKIVANNKLRRMARRHYEIFGRPLGYLHCSVIDSDNVEAFARQGNAFGNAFGGNKLSYRNFGSYELAPPPDVIWVDDGEDNEYHDDDDSESFFSIDFDEEDFQDSLSGTPIMPYYEQVDAVVATFPRQGNGPPDDNSISGRLRGLQWLATHGCALPPGVERILVLDASDLKDLPLNNGDPNLPPDFDIEAFWLGKNRKQTRIILRRAANDAAQAAAKAASEAARMAADAAVSAVAAMDSGDAAAAAEAAMKYQKSAQKSLELVQEELQQSTALRRQFERKGVKVETIEGGEPIEVMTHLGERNGLHSVVWRAGCWGDRGVKAILAGAFQWISAHLAVPAVGGPFWQQMIAENAVQAACGPQSKVKIFANQDDINLEYCDNVDVDEDCALLVDGKPVRHIRLDCRIGLVNEERPRIFEITQTQKMNQKILLEEAPWFR